MSGNPLTPVDRNGVWEPPCHWNSNINVLIRCLIKKPIWINTVKQGGTINCVHAEPISCSLTVTMGEVQPGFVFMTLMEMIFQKRCVSFLFHRHGGCFLPIIPQKANVMWWNVSACVLLQTLAVLTQWLLNMNQWTRNNDTTWIRYTLFNAEQWHKQLFYTETQKHLSRGEKEREYCHCCLHIDAPQKCLLP